MHNFDAAAFYTKWVGDLADTQDLGVNGALADCAPFYGHGKAEADPGWGFAAWVVPLGAASFYDDDRLERAWYPRARAYAEHWVALAANNSGVLSVMNYGDWGNLWPGPLSFKPPAYPQFFFIRAMAEQAASAARLGLVADAARYARLEAEGKMHFVQQFYDAATGCFGNCTDVEQIFGLTLEVLQPGSAEEAAAWRKALAWFDDAPSAGALHPGHFGGGIVSWKLVLPLLDRFNRSDLALRFQLHTDAPPSLGYWIAQGATTLWEVRPPPRIPLCPVPNSVTERPGPRTGPTRPPPSTRASIRTTTSCSAAPRPGTTTRSWGFDAPRAVDPGVSSTFARHGAA